ncbi:MAG: DUF1697 domain-containing protein [Allorhizobium sp.]
MTVHVALIRAINVGGAGKLPMADLKAMAEDIGLTEVSTYIQSGNLIFRSPEPADLLSSKLDAALGETLGKAPGVFLRSRTELDAVIANNPFADAQPSQVLVTFLGLPADDGALHGLIAPDGEEVVVIGREIYVHYPIGSGRTRLKLPILKNGTARNINSVSRLAAMAAELEARP